MVDLKEQLAESIRVKSALLADAERMADVVRAAQLCVTSLRGDGRVLVAGNGGSAADAQHFAGELVSRFYFDRPALASIALSTDTSILTAIGNDYGYELVFSRQIEANGRAGDVFVAISTSGNSPNILRAIEVAKARGLVVIGLTGDTGGKMASLCDVCLRAPSTSTPRIQECHLVLEHFICAYIEDAIFGEQRPS
jgi:D-sedoheptulose 7-phosphate isomerase